MNRNSGIEDLVDALLFVGKLLGVAWASYVVFKTLHAVVSSNGVVVMIPILALVAVLDARGSAPEVRPSVRTTSNGERA